MFLLNYTGAAQIGGQLITGSLDFRIPFTITQYSKQQGLPQSQVLDIVEKGNGNLIVATANGIVEYNGIEFTTFIEDESYKNNIYRKIFWNEKYNKLFGQELSGGFHELYPNLEKIGDDIAHTISDDYIYSVSKSGGIYRTDLDYKKTVELLHANIIGAASIYVNSNLIYVGSSSSLYLIDVKTKLVKKILDSGVYDIQKNPFSNELYFISGNSVFKESKNDSILKVISIEAGQSCEDIDFIDSVECFVATSNGLYQIYDGYIDKYSKKSALPSQFIQSAYFNKKSNCLFIGTGEKGMLELEFKTCYSFISEQGFKENVSLNSIIRNQEGEALVGGNCCDIYKIGIDTVLTYSNTKHSYASLSEIEGTLVAGTWGEGIKLIRNGELIGEIKGTRQLPNNYVHASFQDSRGNIWIGTGNGIAVGNNFSTIKPVLTGKISNEIITFYELKNGNICLGGSDGVFVIDSKFSMVKKLGVKDGIKAKEVRSFYEDEEGKLWIGTYGGGLYCYFNGDLTSINSLKNAKLDKDVFCLANDDFGYFFITSNHGLWRISKKDLNEFYYGKLEYLVPFYYGEKSGIYNTEFNGGFQNNYLKTTYNHFYFPTLEGIVIVAPEEPIFKKLKPLINRVILNDTLVVNDDHVFKRETFSIQFYFSSPDFSEKNNIYYQYKLGVDGEASNWSPLQKSATINFKMLPPGNYVFSVRAIDAFNDKEPTVATYQFEIEPYFYEIFLIKVLFVLVISSMVFMITLYQTKSARKKHAERERIKRRIAELELNVLLAQMNPHFIFNSLNSLKYFLSIGDISKADQFIDDFSFLLRRVMIYSSEKFIAIQDEMEMLTSYVELERIRLNNRFSYTIIASDDLRNKLIPTFIIQPFVENAIKHGFSQSEKKNRLLIEFTSSENGMICIIDDDGIGRENAKNIQTNSPEHESKGISNVLERIAIKKDTFGKNISVKIIDKKDASNNSLGTQVIINIEEIDDTSDNS